MRKVLWAFILFSLYVWAVNTGRDAFLLRQGEAFYEYCKEWAQGADFDFQLDQENGRRKEAAKHKRWF